MQINLAILGEQNLSVANSYVNLGLLYYDKTDYIKALEYYQKALQIQKDILGEHHPEVANSFNYIAECYYNKGSYNEALDYFQKALPILKSFFGEKHPYLGANYNGTGTVYYRKGENDKALEYYQKALQVYSDVVGENSPNVAVTYGNIGISYRSKRDYDRALTFFQKALSIQQAAYGETHPAVAGSYMNIGIISNEKGLWDEAILYYKKALHTFISTIGEKNSSVATLYNNLGVNYYGKEDYDQALFYCQKALQYQIEAYGEVHPKVARTVVNIGILYDKKGEYQKALEYCYKGIQILTKIYGEKHPQIADSYNSYGYLYSKTGEYTKALHCFQKAIIANLPGFNDTIIYNNPKLLNFQSKPFFIASLTNKAEAFYCQYKKTNIPEDIRISLSTYDLAFRIIYNMRNEYNAYGSGLFLSESTKGICFNAIQVAMDSPFEIDKAKAFEFIEKGKAASLAYEFTKSNAAHLAGVPDSLIEEEKYLKKSISGLTIELDKQKQGKGAYDSIMINALENKKFECSLKLDALISSFETSFPAYYNIKYADKTISIDQLQRKLDSETALMNYFVGDSGMFVTIVTDSLFSIQKIEIDSSFEKTVAAYFKNIKNAESGSFVANSQFLYNKLVKSVKKYIEAKKNLIIIPDDYLFYLPFETLVSNVRSSKTDYTKLDYLINFYTVTYNYSATVWYNSRKKEPFQPVKQKCNFIGFAPVFDLALNNGTILSSNPLVLDTSYREGFPDIKKIKPLPYSKVEVTSILHLFEKKKKEAKAYLNAEASESNFKNNIADYTYVHISSHGFSNDKTPSLSGIVFSQQADALNAISHQQEDGVLYAGEAYNLNLKADLVVLSSCESGFGKLIKGEGLLALSRGLIYAGTPNIVFSLWKALDKPTKDIMVNFYSNVLDEKTYADALRTTKLEMIKDSRTAFPHFWGGFVLIGR